MSSLGWKSSISLCAVASLACVVGTSASAAGSDLNGDGRSDLVIGSAGESLAGFDGLAHGAANVIFGRKGPLLPRRGAYLTQAVPGAHDTPEDGDSARAGTTGDFDGDGRDDIALQVFGENLAGFDGINHGAVNVIFGSRSHLGRRGAFLSKAAPKVPGEPGSEDFFGAATAAGDFDNDGRDDLAVASVEPAAAAPTTVLGVGAVYAFYGARNGFALKRTNRLAPAVGGLRGPAPTGGERFGDALATGDFNGDGFEDLAIGINHQGIGNVRDAGAVQIVYGGRKGLRVKGNINLAQASTGSGDGPEEGDAFGDGLVSGDFDGDGRSDLAVGAPGEDIVEGDSAGAVSVLFGSRGGLRASEGRWLTGADVPATDGSGFGQDHPSQFGAALAAGRLDRNRRDDLAIGADPGSHSGESGSIFLALSSRRGPAVAAGITQATIGADDTPAAGDGFGTALAIANLNGRRPMEIVVGEPNFGSEDTPCGVGSVHLLPVRNRKVRRDDVRTLTQDSYGLLGDGAEPCDYFGSTVTAGAP